MARTNERGKITHNPSTLEVFFCLSSMPNWATILLNNGSEKPYKLFLQWLLDKQFYKDKEDKIAIKKIAADYKTETVKVTKWIHEIYNDIIEFNCDNPETFANGYVTCFFRHYDNHVTMHLNLKYLPREYESFLFPFIKAKMGIDFFWVSRIEHAVADENIYTTIWLEGGFLNKYREMAIEEGLFKGWLDFRDKWEKASFEIDEILLTHQRR
jgi:hypothetical protein